MDDTFHDFNNRHRAILKKHRRLAQGYVTRVNKHGVIEHVPLNKSKAFSLRGLVFLVCGFMIFKGYLLAGLGPQTFQKHVATLAEGNAFEKMGAWLMQADPVTRIVADGLLFLGV